MNKKTDLDTINSIQKDNNYIILNNPLASPKFVRLIGRGKEITVNDTYTPKVFYEIVSRLLPEHLEDIKRTETIKFEISIKEFLETIGANIKNFKYLIDSVDYLQTTLLKWKGHNENFSVPIITKSIHNDKTGKIELFVDSDLAKHILQIKQKDNFSFLKSNIFKLQNAQAIKLYPLFERWLNYGRYVTDLERFKNDFSYNTSGYNRFNKLEIRVLRPAIDEINEKTNLLIHYELTGDNLESQRPRVKGLIFIIKAKPKILKETPPNNVLSKEVKSQKEKYTKKEISTLYTIFASLKFESTSMLLRETAEATIIQWVERNGYDAVYNGLMRAKDTYKQEIKNSIGFFSGDYFQNHKHYLIHKQEAKEEQQREKEKREEKERKIKRLELIIDDFRKRENNHFIKLFNELKEDERLEKIESIKNNILYFKGGKVSEMGIYTIGKSIAESTGYDPQKTLQNLAKRDYNAIIMFDKENKPFIQENIFNEQTQIFEAVPNN